MKKTLFRTVLVLAALTACNKEVETLAPVVDNGQEEATPGKVTLTFTATISEETRTAYPDDKTGKWVVGDKITVCVSNNDSDNPEYKTAVFEATTETATGMEFTGQVQTGYTTIVSGIYPANDVYQDFQDDYFTNGAVTAVFLPHAYNLEDTNDTGKFIPLVGSSNDGETLTFHHFCSAMKVTLTNIPDDATLFTFTTNKQQITTDFALIDGRISLPEPNDGTNSTVSFRFEATSFDTRSFYIPIPDGSLIANSYVTIQNDDEEILFKKIITTSPSFGLNSKGKDAIRVLPSVACWTKNEDWGAFYYGPYVQSNKIYTGIRTQNVDSSFNLIRLTNNAFTNTYHSSIAEYLASSSFKQSVDGFTKSYSSDITMGYANFTEEPYYLFIIGLDGDLHFTGEYNCIEVVKPHLETPTGWSITVSENTSNYTIRYIVPTNNTQWQYIPFKASDFETKYLGDFECALYTLIRSRKSSHESDPTTWLPRTGIQAYTATYSGEYIILCAGIDENYMPTGAFCRLDYDFTKEEPSEDYNKWIGTWTVVDNQPSPKTNTWTISRKRANHTYNVKGIGSASAIICEALYDSDSGNLVIQSQENFWTINNSGADRMISLYGRYGDDTFDQGVYNIMYAEFTNDAHTSAELKAYNDYTSYYLPYYIDGVLNQNTSYGIRYLPSSMTKQ